MQPDVMEKAVPPMTDIILQAKNISKAFVGVQALSDVSLDIHTGQIHCLVGENGSGKSTFVKIVSGVHAPDSGSIIVDGHAYVKLSPTQALHEGIQVIYQDLSLFPHMTIAENIAINSIVQSGRKTVDWKDVYRIATRQLERIQVSLDINKTVEEASMANRQLTAICRALAQDARILFMDEPTTALTQQEVENLLAVIDGLRKKGIAVVFISHKLDEVFRVADEITVFRDGHKIGDFAGDELTTKRLSYYMTGREVNYPQYHREKGDTPPVLEVRNLTKQDQYENISFSVRPGDILGVTGLLGSGRTEIALSLFGLNAPDAGDILVEGKKRQITSPSAAKAAGIVLLPEDRLTQGLFLTRSVRENISSAMVGDLNNRFGILNKQKETELAKTSIDELSIRTPSDETVVQFLSGGNQQKVVVAKWGNTAPKVFIMDTPTVGVDIGSKSEIYDLIQSYAKKGMGIVLISDEVEELMTNCSRILVMAKGHSAALLEETELASPGASERVTALIREIPPAAKEQP